MNQLYIRPHLTVVISCSIRENCFTRDSRLQKFVEIGDLQVCKMYL